MDDQVAPVRPVSASQHSGVDKALRDSFVFQEKPISSAEYFVSGGSNDEDFVSTVMTSLKNATNDSQLQHGLFNAMSILPTIIVPPESKRPPKEKETNFIQKLVNIVNPTSYQEKDMRSLLDLYAKHHLPSLVGNRTLQKMKDAQPGLFVRATSRPYLSVIIKDAADDRDIATGEVKNDDNYSVEDTLKQNGAYLMLLLYWWRVVVGREVSTVHGFTLCGPFCRDLKQRKRNWRGRPASDARYSICLLRLSAPKYLGGIPCLTYFKGTSSLNDDSAVRRLCQFLMNGKLWGQKTTGILSYPCPAFFTAPVNFAMKLSSANWKLQYNGTAALVFQCHGKDEVFEVMELANDKLRSECSECWSEYLEKQEKKNATKPLFYVKIVTTATNLNFMHYLGNLRVKARRLNDEDFLRTYPVDSIESDTCYCLLMADRGGRIESSMSWQLCDLNKMFRDLWGRTIALSESSGLQHGDIAKHNILIERDDSDGDHFVLIDWDEARFHPKSRASQGDDYLRLQHPERLRRIPLLYTKVQLALLYCNLIGNHVQTKADWLNDPDSGPELQEYASSVRESDELSIVETAKKFVLNTEAKFKN